MHPSVWDSLVMQLGEQGIVARAQALPGYAENIPEYAHHDTQKGTTIADMLNAQVDSMMDRLHQELSIDGIAPTKITLCAWSLGALLAMYAAQRYPDKIERLILIGATPSFVQRADWSHGMAEDALAEFSGAVAHDPDLALKRFITLFNQGDRYSRAIVRQLGQMQTALSSPMQPSVQLLLEGLTLLRDVDLRKIVPTLHQPTLLLHGANDPLMPLAAAQWLVENLPKAQLRILPEAAHVPFLSDTAYCVEAIASMIAQAL
jgi:pimeloyl-[acyl-carrier protein] methyl ester esterase